MRRGQRAHPGFTLIELIVVVVLLGIMAAIITPRLFESASRRAGACARELTTLLSVAAHRDSLGADRLALEYDAPARTLRMLMLRSGDGEAQWRVDPLVSEVVIPADATLAAFADGRALDASAWRIAMPPTEPRPTIELRLSLAGARSEGWAITLFSAASSANLQAPGAAARAALTSIDLDAAGVGNMPW